jgi:ATP-dependent Lhr-like helicase
VDDLFECLEQLACLPLAADAWESDVLPARLHPYHPSFLDTILQEGGLQWLGFEKKKIAFCFASDLDFLKEPMEIPAVPDQPKTQKNREIEQIFETPGVRYTFTNLLGMTPCDSGRLSDQIWHLVWQGQLSNDAFSAVRKGIETQFKAPEGLKDQARSRPGRRQVHGRRSFSQWRGSLPMAGHWFKPDIPRDPLDFMGTEEVNKDRVRLLLDRYGILFRELLLREHPQFRWQSVFRSLRLMELTGEILAGHFFEAIPGLQFISPKAFLKLQAKLPEESIYFMNATDPASVCGISLIPFKQNFPKRLSHTHLAFKGKELKLVAMGNGKTLLIHTDPDDDHLIEYLAPLTHLLNRYFKPLKKITIEKINGESADKSRYVKVLETVFSVLVEYKKVTLYKKM